MSSREAVNTNVSSLLVKLDKEIEPRSTNYEAYILATIPCDHTLHTRLWPRRWKGTVSHLTKISKL